MGVLAAFVKNSIERKRYTIDYAPWLDEGEVLSDFAVLVSPASADALLADAAYASPDNKKLTVFLSKGVPGEIYTVSFVSSTSQGQTKRDDLQVQVT